MFTLGIIGFLVVLFTILGIWQRRVDRQEKETTLAHLRDAQARGTNKPITQYPQINPYTCIGCGSCIEACPEDNVIGLVNGIAHIVNGSRCVGHGNCEYACPVNAIKVGLGDVALRPDIPVLSEDLETSIPDIYIAGELGGISLIRNAMAQGAQVVDTIARRLQKQHVPTGSDILDLLIVGAGPAGLAAGLKATELKLNYLMISQEDVGGAVSKYPRRKMTLVQPVTLPLHGRLKGGEYEKETLIELWNQLIKTYNIRLKTRVGLVSVKTHGPIFEVQTTGGPLRCRTVVMALGRRGTPRRLGIPGEEATKVMYQLIDASTYIRQKILIVGGGDAAIEAVTGLANQVSNVVTLSYRKENFFRLKSRNEQRINEYIAQKRIQVYFSSEVESIEPKNVALLIEKNGRKERLRIPNDYVFIFAGGDPPYPLLKQMGIRFGGESLTAPKKAAI